MARSPRWFALLLAPLAACEGLVGSLPGDPVALPGEAVPGVSGIRRLTRAEYDTTLVDLLDDRTNSGFAALPADFTDPFDNDYRTQLASASLVEALETLATDAAQRLTADPAKRDALIGCTPTGPGDAACLAAFVRRFGRLALRRPLTDDEVTRFAGLSSYGQEANDFDFAVELVIRALLQHPEFIYRVELDRAVPERPGVHRLNAFELATRMSFFLWGSTPPEWLIERAEAGELDTTEQIRDAARQLLADPRARARVERFHALWLGYHQLPHPLQLTQALQNESAALVDRVVFDAPADYLTLFTVRSTWVDQTLAQHYGLPWAGGTTPQWVSLEGTPRQGLLSHGSVLSAGAKFNDTSPTQRGIFVRTRLFCRDVPPPPPGVNVDEKPTGSGSPCKADIYREHASNGNCAACHRTIDPVGFGLERFNRMGQERDHDDNLTQCPISGDGTVTGLPGGDVAFNGPAGLADAIVGNGTLESCAVTQTFRFAMGRREAEEDLALLAQLTERFKSQQHDFQGLLVDFVSDPTFAYRTEEAP